MITDLDLLADLLRSAEVQSKLGPELTKALLDAVEDITWGYELDDNRAIRAGVRKAVRKAVDLNLAGLADTPKPRS